jgi:hypothetical protein
VQQKEEIQKEIKPIEAQEESLVDALQAVREAEATVASRRRVLSDIVNSVVRDTPLDKLKGCGVKAGDLKTALTVDPGGPFEIKKPGSVAFTIKGGLPPYGATLAGGLAGLIVAQSAPFSPAVNVVATNDTAEGQFAVVISDSSDQSKTVMVTVKKGDGKPDGEQQKPAATDALNQFAVKLNQDRPIVTVDGVTVTVTKAEMTGDRVVVSIADPQVTPNAKTDSVATEVRKELWDKHGGKQLNLQENQIVFDNNSLGMLNKAALDAKKTKTGRKK